MRGWRGAWLLAALLSPWLACSGDPAPEQCGGALFGRPNAKTGLDAGRCRPTCGCGDEAWTARELASEEIDALGAWTLLDELPELVADPYEGDPPPEAPEGEVCAVTVLDLAARSYRLDTFASVAAAEANGSIVTHHDACGLCSTLADLAVYARETDLTTPVRQCGLDTASAGFEANVACLAELGFTHPCAQIWAYNTAHTRKECLGPCLALLHAPYHDETGALNECLQCDEDRSGPVFKAVAGRTRRNTGLASALCRPCDQVQPIAHEYPR